MLAIVARVCRKTPYWATATIVTTIDKKAQDAAVKAVNEKMPPQYFKDVKTKDPNGRAYDLTTKEGRARVVSDPRAHGTAPRTAG